MPQRRGPVPANCPSCRDTQYRAIRSAWRPDDATVLRTKWQTHKRRRNAIKRGRAAETFTHRSIFERDGWKCGICRSAVDPSLQYPDPMSASLDHVIPLWHPATPGHVRSNVQCSHLHCNTVIKQHRILMSEEGPMATSSSKPVEIPLTDPDGEPWIATSEAEAHELMARGYKRQDGGKQDPPGGKGSAARSASGAKAESGSSS